jgi:DNA-binding XRE family transcriptional regulator
MTQTDAQHTTQHTQQPAHAHQQPERHHPLVVSYKQAAIMEKKNFIYNLVFLRARKGYRAQDMVRLLGHDVKYKTYESWEEQRGFPPVFICRKICQIFRTDMETMFTERYKYPED